MSNPLHRSASVLLADYTAQTLTMAERVSGICNKNKGFRDELDKPEQSKPCSGFVGFKFGQPAARHNKKHINVFVASIQYSVVKGIQSKSAYACLKTGLPRLQSFALLSALLC